MEPSLAVAQLGARMHYAVPRILEELGFLERFFTDACAVKGWPRALNLLPESLRSPDVIRLLGRQPKGVPLEKITSFSTFGLKYFLRLRASKSHSQRLETYLWAGTEFCHLVLKSGLNSATGVYTFNSAGLELLEAARARGLRTLMEQTIAPYLVEHQLLDKERIRFPKWEERIPLDSLGKRFAQREFDEWQLADVILCGSDFVREGIAACNGPVERCVVVPYGVDERFAVPNRTPPLDRRLRVLTVGAVGLRKGTPYVLETAKRLKGSVDFRIVGAVNNIPPEILSDLRSAVDLTGSVPRSQIAAHYAWADVFLLPSICEGSATATYEALSAGLPVICTPNTGSIVRDGIDGFLVPPGNVEAIVSALASVTDLGRRSLDKSVHSDAGEFVSYKSRVREAIVGAAK